MEVRLYPLAFVNQYEIQFANYIVYYKQGNNCRIPSHTKLDPIIWGNGAIIIITLFIYSALYKSSKVLHNKKNRIIELALSKK